MWATQGQEPAAEPTPMRPTYDFAGSATRAVGSQWGQAPPGGLHVPEGCFEVQLTKDPAARVRFGFANVPSADGRSLLITWIDENGLLGNWNAYNADSGVREGDAIVNVNGVFGDSEAMRMQLQGDAARMVVQPTGTNKSTPRLTRA